MKAKCIQNDGTFISEKYLDNIKGKSIYTKYDVTINDNYVVYGVCIYKNMLKYLISGNKFNPGWYPAELFDIMDYLFILESHFVFFGYEKYFISAIWGYKELIDINHFDGLLEREDKDLEIFFKRKSEIDEYANLRYFNK